MMMMMTMTMMVMMMMMKMMTMVMFVMMMLTTTIMMSTPILDSLNLRFLGENVGWTLSNAMDRGRNCKINVCSGRVLRGSLLSRNLTRRVEIARGRQKRGVSFAEIFATVARAYV